MANAERWLRWAWYRGNAVFSKGKGWKLEKDYDADGNQCERADGQECKVVLMTLSYIKRKRSYGTIGLLKQD